MSKRGMKSPVGKPSEEEAEYAAGTSEHGQPGVVMTTTPHKRGVMDYFKPSNRDPPQEVPVTKSCAQSANDALAYGRDELVGCFKSVQYEFSPPPSVRNLTLRDVWAAVVAFVFVPRLPAFKDPGWLTNYAVGLVTPGKQLPALESLWDDFWAGITVSFCLIPQGISYGLLANLPAIRGLYAAVLPSAVYTFFGSSMQLAVGPVAIVSLLMGKIVSQYGFAGDNSPEGLLGASNLAAQTMFCCGIILTAMSLLSMGSLIRFVSQPVFSGFTTGAAMTIGLSQLRNAFGFTFKVPQVGDTDTHFNYQVMQWYAHNWNGMYTSKTNPKSKNPHDEGLGKLYRNHFAEEICGGVLVPLMLFALVKTYWKPAGERKKELFYRGFIFVANMMPLLAMIIAGSVAFRIKTDGPNDYYARQLRTIGVLKSGIYDLISIPTFSQPWGKLFQDVIPLTLIAFMESYSVARKIAVERNELHILSGNQELWAVGVANMIGSVGSSYPVAGSFSRSALNAASGARTPMAKVVCMLVIVLVISTLTDTLTYIPTAANSAVIWAALLNLIDFTDLWYTFKLSKQDCFVQLLTLVVTFVVNEEDGLACGIGMSIFFLLYTMSFSPASAPFVSVDDGASVTVRLNTDLSFFTVTRIKDFLAFDVMLHRATPVEQLTIDFNDVKSIDKSALMAFKEIFYQAAHQDIQVEVVNVSDAVLAMFDKAGLSKAVFVADGARAGDKGTVAAPPVAPADEKI